MAEQKTLSRRGFVKSVAATAGAAAALQGYASAQAASAQSAVPVTTLSLLFRGV